MQLAWPNPGSTPPPVTFVRSVSESHGTVDTVVTVAEPSGVQDGDLVLVFCTSNSDITWSDDNGSTPFSKDLADYSPTNQGMTQCVFSRIIQSGDPSSYSFDTGGTNRWRLIAVAIANPNVGDRYDVDPVGGGFSNGDTTVDADSITTLSANAIHFCWAGWDGPGTPITATPAGYTVAYSSGAGGDGAESLAVVYKTIPTPSATGPQTFDGDFDGCSAGNVAVKAD